MRRAFLLIVLVVGSTGVATAGTVSGRVVFRGEPPVIQQFPITKDRETCGGVTAADPLVVSKANGGVEKAVVYLEGVGPVAGSPAPDEVALENRACRFVPRVLAVRVGAELAIVNADPVLHNLRAWLPGRRHVFNVVQPTLGQVSRRTIKRPGVMTLTCDTHVHMMGYLLAFEHPYFAVTGASGAFRIPAVPPGAYRITAWHEGWNVERRDPDGRLVYEPARLVSREVVVPESGEVSLTFELTPRP